jgi:2-keto-4-pentenoate hydratase/2-oxohepta-3-ene-1,7-dioic acid hydratase in catechol pathway
MIFKIDQQIKYLEEVAGIHLKEGDLIMTGTPENIAPVREGDTLEASMSVKGKEISTLIERNIQREAKPSHEARL